MRRGGCWVRALVVGGSVVCVAGMPAHASPAHDGQGPVTPRASALPDSVIEARTTAIAAQLRCPVCQGLSIQDSPSDLSQQMRALVRDQVAAGRTDDEVRAYFVSKYGEWILLSPRARGFNLVAYGLPLALLAVGGVVITLSVRRWAAAPPAAEAEVSSPDAHAPRA